MICVILRHQWYQYIQRYVISRYLRYYIPNTKYIHKCVFVCVCVDRGNFQIGGTGSAVSSKDNSQASSSTLLGLKDMSCVLLGEQDWPNTEHAVREVMAME